MSCRKQIEDLDFHLMSVKRLDGQAGNIDKQADVQPGKRVAWVMDIKTGNLDRQTGNTDRHAGKRQQREEDCSESLSLVSHRSPSCQHYQQQHKQPVAGFQGKAQWH